MGALAEKAMLVKQYAHEAMNAWEQLAACGVYGLNAAAMHAIGRGAPSALLRLRHAMRGNLQHSMTGCAGG